MNSFQRALNFTLLHECVFAKGHYGDMLFVVPENVSGDSGGLTKYGIDQRSHPEVNIAELTLVGASRIYLNEYWSKCRCDALPDNVAITVFDAGVNCGTARSIMWLQAILGVNVDAHIGPLTISAASTADPVQTTLALLHRRQTYYKDISTNPRLTKFLQGWLNRVNDLATYLQLPSPVD